MPEIVYARWTCRSCGRAGSVSGPRTAGALAFDPVPINCFFCFETVLVDLPPGLDPRRLRVEGEHVRRPSGCLCGGEVQEYWDGAGTPLAVCLRCEAAQRRPAAAADETEWERLYEAAREAIDRRRVQGGWEFRARFGPPGRRRLLAPRAAEAIVVEALEPDPARPLKEVFADIRAEAQALLAQGARPRPRVPAEVSTRTPRV